MPEDLVVQVPILKEVLSLMKIKICEKEGYEADDVIGTLAKQFDLPTYIYTGGQGCLSTGGRYDERVLYAQRCQRYFGTESRKFL